MGHCFRTQMSQRGRPSSTPINQGGKGRRTGVPLSTLSAASSSLCNKYSSMEMNYIRTGNSTNNTSWEPTMCWALCLGRDKRKQNKTKALAPTRVVQSNAKCRNNFRILWCYIRGKLRSLWKLGVSESRTEVREGALEEMRSDWGLMNMKKLARSRRVGKMLRRENHLSSAQRHKQPSFKPIKPQILTCLCNTCHI